MEPFRFKQFDVQQADEVFKVGTDGCLLGALADIENAETILDVGTGTGLISLMIAQRNTTAMITAIDINAYAVSVSRKNFSNSPFHERLSCIESNFITEFECDADFDAIVCNPPFFKNSLPNQDLKKAMARHEIHGGVIQMLPKMASMINENGTISIIIPSERVEEVAISAQENTLYISERVDIRPFSDQAANRTFLNLTKTLKTLLYREYVLYHDQNELSVEAKELLQPFYLNL